MTIEGSLDILWMNGTDRAATPKYDLIFARYQGFKNGAQQPNRIVGPAALESYLVKLGFRAEDAVEWVKKLNQQVSASIPNVMMPSEHLGDYGITA